MSVMSVQVITINLKNFVSSAGLDYLGQGNLTVSLVPEADLETISD